MALHTGPGANIAIVPLIGNQETDEAHWLGALFSKLLIEHLAGAGLPTLEYNTVAHAVAKGKHALPLKESSIEALRADLKLRALVHGRYVFDEAGGMIGLRLIVSGPDLMPTPMEVSFPIAGFTRFVERVSLALIERLGVSVDDALRERVKAVPRPANFEAFRQVAQARAAWAKGQHELALAAATSALTLDPDYEEASTIEVAIARAADDTTTAQEAFRRWAAIAAKRGRPSVAAERLLTLGHWLRGRGKWIEARHAYEDARSAFEREKNEVGAAWASNNLASLDLLTGNTQAAIRTYRRSLRVFETSPEAERDAAVTLYNLSIAHKRLGQREEALTAIEQALTLARRLKDNHLQARSLAQRGAIRDDLGEWNQAQADYTQAARLLDVLGDESGLAAIKGLQAILLKQQGSYDRAEVLLLEALEATEQQSDAHEQAILWLNLADLYFAMQLYDEAWPYAEQALEAFTHLKSAWTDQAKGLVTALERAIEETTTKEAATPGESPVNESPFTPSEELPGPEGLYNTDDLYDNENAEQV